MTHVIEVKPNKRIDTKLSTPLFNIPLATIPAGTPPTSLAQRNLLRHLTWSLPSGQDIARKIARRVLKPTDLADVAQIRKSFATSTPLWFYILREAELTQDGLHLGAVGGRIVGEVFIGLLQSDPNSFLNAQPDFEPTVPTETGRGRLPHDRLPHLCRGGSHQPWSVAAYQGRDPCLS